MNRKVFCVAALSFLLLALAAGATEPRINYQAYLTDPQGAVIDGNVSVDLSLWTDPVASSQDEFLYAEEHNNLAVDKGLLSLVIGTGLFDQGQDPLASEMLVGEVWLEIGINGETLMPRRRLFPVARALQAELAEAVDGGAVGTIEVANDSLLAIDLGDEAGTVFQDGDQDVELVPPAHQAIRLITLTAPTAGYVIITGSGTMGVSPFASARCGVGTSPLVDVNRSVLASAGTQSLNVPFSTTRVVAVTAGPTDFRLVCQGANPTVVIYDTSLTAIFVPTQY